MEYRGEQQYNRVWLLQSTGRWKGVWLWVTLISPPTRGLNPSPYLTRSRSIRQWNQNSRADEICLKEHETWNHDQYTSALYRGVWIAFQLHGISQYWNQWSALMCFSILSAAEQGNGILCSAPPPFTMWNKIVPLPGRDHRRQTLQQNGHQVHTETNSTWTHSCHRKHRFRLRTGNTDGSQQAPGQGHAEFSSLQHSSPSSSSSVLTPVHTAYLLIKHCQASSSCTSNDFRFNTHTHTHNRFCLNAPSL